MSVINYSRRDTVFLDLNADSTFSYSGANPILHDTIPGWHSSLNLTGTWSVRNEKILEFTLPPRQEMFVMPFRMVYISKNELHLLGPGARAG
jgi:hypothetical protein